MSFDDHPTLNGTTALERARLLSQALTDAARKARISKRSRKVFQAGGFQARRGAGLFRLYVWASFLLVVVVPTTLSWIYYLGIASDQYVAETQFTVMGGAVPTNDSIGKLTGIPAIAIVQDTQIVTSYIHSRAAVEKLDQAIGLRQRYAGDDVDFLARFDSSSPSEEFVRYWGNMVTTSISLPAGIVSLKVRAFSAQDSVAISKAILTICEDLINELNDRMNGDSVRSAEQDLQKASDRLAAARLALEKVRNDEGILDTTKTAETLTKLVTELKSSLMLMQQEYDTAARSVSATAPQMRAARSRIETTQGQIVDLERQLTSSSGETASNPSLSHTMTKFAELDLERQIAERLYAGAASAVEVARMTVERKKMYLNAFVTPALPEEPRLPRRGLYSVLILLGCLSIWAISVGIVASIRNNMA